MIVTELTETPLLPPGFKIPTTRYVHSSVRMRQLIETEPYLFGPGIYDPFGAQLAMYYGFKSCLFHLSNLLQAMAEKQEQGYIALQRQEWASGKDFPTKSHHFFSGVPYHHLVGKMYDASRLGQEFVEDLPGEK